MGHNLAILALETCMGSVTGWGDLDPEVVRKVVREEGAAVIREVLRDRETIKSVWLAGIEVAQEHAQQRAGAWALSGIGALLKRGVMLAAVAALLYSVGGWSAMKFYLSGKA